MDNLAIYNKVRQVPDEAKKRITGGRLNGMTDINPMWRIKAMTELFGPCGFGWKYVITRREMVPDGSGQMAVFVDVELSYRLGDEWSAPIPGTGGSLFIAKEKGGLYTSDECYKMALTDALWQALDPLVSGGTGSMSDSLEMPPFLPDRLEPGTLNLPGIYGLGAALDWWEGQDQAALRRREQRLTGHLIARLAEYEEDGLRVLGTRDEKKQVGVVSVDFVGRDNAQCAYRLERDFGIQTRCGLHCAPLAHKTLGTYPQGTVRFSVGPFTAFEDIDYVQGAVAEILCE